MDARLTHIAFHFNVADPLAYLPRLLLKAYRSGAQVVVLADQPSLEAMDNAMWQGTANTDFFPHCLAANASAACLDASAVILAHDLSALPGLHSAGGDVLVNLLPPVPPAFAQFSRLIEIVSTSQESRDAARERWKMYKSSGYALNRHDLQMEVSGH